MSSTTQQIYTPPSEADFKAAGITKPIEIKAMSTALEFMQRAYCPYSKYKVGCAVVYSGEEVIGGCNIENASYGLTICAERVAFGTYVSQNPSRPAIELVAVVTKDGGSCCGACRQFMREFIHPSANVPYIIFSENLSIIRRTHIDELLPFSFGPENLDEKTTGASGTSTTTTNGKIPSSTSTTPSSTTTAPIVAITNGTSDSSDKSTQTTA